MGEQAGDELFQVSVHQAVGGDEFFVELVERFYAGVAEDPVMRPMYPDDLTEPKRHLAGFLIQFWRGSHAYSDERGHPRLRMRQMPVRIRPAERGDRLPHQVGPHNTLLGDSKTDGKERKGKD